MTDFPEKRDLDDIYIRVEADGKWESRCLTDCPWETVAEWLEQKPPEWATEVAKGLHKKLRRFGDDLKISGL